MNKTIPAFILALSCLSGAAKSPNIIMILADDLGYGELSCYGQEKYQTPRIDEMAEQGMLFTDHYAASPVCAPSRNGLMTGEHTGHLTVRNNFAFGKQDEGIRVCLKSTDLTLAQYLQDEGYKTALIGKWGLGDESTVAAPWKKGWDYFFGFTNQKHAHNHYPEFLYRNADKILLSGNYGSRQNAYASDLFTEETLSFIEQQKKSEFPFFLYLAYTTPHAPLACPADTVEETLKLYPGLKPDDTNQSALIFASMVRRLDSHVGAILDKLKSVGLDKDTVVFFTSDNGPHTEGGKENTLFRSAGPLRGAKRDLYEGGIRVPMIVRWPDRIQPGSVTGHPSAFWDFTATALQIVKPDKSQSFNDGISYLPTLVGKSKTQALHDHLYWEFIIDGKTRQAIRMGKWKGIRNSPQDHLELYDLDQDVGESNDLSERYLDQCQKMIDAMNSSRIESALFPLL